MKFNQASLIKAAAILTAVPRWIMTLVRAEGLGLPAEWEGVWLIVNVILAIGMSVTEALAINYIFSAWRNQKDKKARNLMYILVAIMVAFVGAITPSIVASVSGRLMHEVLGPYGEWVWGAVIALTTILAVGGVGYASKDVSTVSTRLSTELSTNSTRAHSHVQNGDTSETVHGQSMDMSTVDKLSTKVSTLDAIVDIYRDNPKARPKNIQDQLRLPRSTYYKYIGELIDAGRLTKDGSELRAQDKTI